jgi:sortase A
MALTIKPIGLRDSPIKTTDSQRALDNGLIHLPQTSRPWERKRSRNVYVVGHRMGWPGTESWKIFYRLPELQRGDKLTLTAGGETYRYKVSEKLVVDPWDVWVTDPVKGRDLLSLQTCVGPNFEKRLIVRADRV